MTQTIGYWLGDTMAIVLIAVAALGIMATITSFKRLKKNSGEAMVFFTLSAFLWALHCIWISYAPPESILFHASIGFWQWLVFLLAPALALVFLIHAAYWYAKFGSRPALIRIFLGLTLVCLLFMLGQDWSMHLKGTLTLFWIFFMWRVEFPPKPKRAPFIFVTRRLL
jgi:hypothetical protein